MSELKAGVIKTPHNEGMSFNRDSDHVAVTEDETEFYLKSEADKFISDLEESHKMEVGQLLIEIRRLENLCASYRHDCDNLAIREANALKEIGRDNRVIRHQKYKRCLAMARWCFTRSNFFFVVGRNEGGRFAEERFRRSRLYSKWHQRWLEIAKQFKEAKCR